MNIKIKVKYDYLNLVCELFDYLTSSDEYIEQLQLTKEFRVNFSIVEELVFKFKKKIIGKSSHDEFKLTIKDYQGYYLCKFIYENTSKLYINKLYEKTLLNGFYAKIDEQL